MDYQLRYAGPTWDLSVDELVVAAGVLFGQVSVKEAVTEKLQGLVAAVPRGVFGFYEWYSAQEGFQIEGDTDLIQSVITLHAQRMYVYEIANPVELFEYLQLLTPLGLFTDGGVQTFQEMDDVESCWHEPFGSPRVPTFRKGHYWFYLDRTFLDPRYGHWELVIHRSVHLIGQHFPDHIAIVAKEFAKLTGLPVFTSEAVN